MEDLAVRVGRHDQEMAEIRAIIRESARESHRIQQDNDRAIKELIALLIAPCDVENRPGA